MGERLSAYREALEYLYVRTTGPWRFGLERTRALLDLLGNPHRRFPVMHVGGTNGKGSVVAMLETVLRSQGLRVAAYTSPHLVDFRERVRVDGETVTEQAVADFVHTWGPDIERLEATFFEATTAMAFSLFAEAAPDVAIVEVGLGGRLDATNVVDPLVACVTSIGLDHREFLGPDHAAIAREKAGIFKRGRAAVVGEPDPALRGLLAERARAAGAAPVRVVHDEMRVEHVRVGPDGTAFRLVSARGPHEGRTGLVGRHQALNAATALCLLDAVPSVWTADQAAAAGALVGASAPGRFDRRGRFIFDVAHNPEGSVECARSLIAVGAERPIAVLFAVLNDKDWTAMMRALAPAVDRFVVTNAPSAPAARAWDPRHAADHAAAQGWPVVLETDFGRALDVVQQGAATVLVTGSFHTVGDAMLRLHLSPHAQ